MFNKFFGGGDCGNDCGFGKMGGGCCDYLWIIILIILLCNCGCKIDPCFLIIILLLICGCGCGGKDKKDFCC